MVRPQIKNGSMFLEVKTAYAIKIKAKKQGTKMKIKGETKKESLPQKTEDRLGCQRKKKKKKKKRGPNTGGEVPLR